MEDISIIQLYWQRDQQAIHESNEKYGSYCAAIAWNILHSSQDTEECVSDTWLRAWNSIPPARPSRLSAFFGRITRNLAIDRYRQDISKRNGGGQAKVCLEELAECISESTPFEDVLALRDLLNEFLESIKEKPRKIFMFRYWYCMSVEEIAKRLNMDKGAVKMSMSRTRTKLRKFLEKEGVGI